MKDHSKPKIDIKAWLIKNWSNVLFFVLVLLFLMPSSRVYLQTKIAYIFSTAPEIIAQNDQQKISDYNVVLKNLQGEIINLNQSRGKPVLINFWATWCPPCLAELPELHDLYQKYKNEVDFYFISQEESEKLKKFLASKEYDLPVYNQVSNVPRQLKSDALPSTYLINKEGQIIAFAQKSAKWNAEEIQNLISKILL
jgi:thiol-disulfide isomerase/thioredoxin